MKRIPVKGNPFLPDTVGTLELSDEYYEYLFKCYEEGILKNGKLPQTKIDFAFFYPKDEIDKNKRGIVQFMIHPDIPEKELKKQALEEFKAREKLKEKEVSIE